MIGNNLFDAKRFNIKFCWSCGPSLVGLIGIKEPAVELTLPTTKAALRITRQYHEVHIIDRLLNEALKTRICGHRIFAWFRFFYPPPPQKNLLPSFFSSDVQTLQSWWLIFWQKCLTSEKKERKKESAEENQSCLWRKRKKCININTKCENGIKQKSLLREKNSNLAFVRLTIAPNGRNCSRGL